MALVHLLTLLHISIEYWDFLRIRFLLQPTCASHGNNYCTSTSSQRVRVFSCN